MIVADAVNFEPRDVKPVPRDQWGGEDEEDAADVRTCPFFKGNVIFLLLFRCEATADSKLLNNFND